MCMCMCMCMHMCMHRIAPTHAACREVQVRHLQLFNFAAGLLVACISLSRSAVYLYRYIRIDTHLRNRIL